MPLHPKWSSRWAWRRHVWSHHTYHTESINYGQNISVSDLNKNLFTFQRRQEVSLLMMLTMSSSVACTHWTKPWSDWSTSWPTSCPRSQTGYWLWLLHPRHRPLPLHSHLEVVRKGLTPGQHLVGHDLGSELVQLVLIKGSWASWASRVEARSEIWQTGAETRSSARAWARATWRARPVSRTHGVLIPCRTI